MLTGNSSCPAERSHHFHWIIFLLERFIAPASVCVVVHLNHFLYSNHQKVSFFREV
jgi:hypothetical protein